MALRGPGPHVGFEGPGQQTPILNKLNASEFQGNRISALGLVISLLPNFKS